MRSVQLEVDLGEGASEETIALSGDRIVLGRAKDCGVRIFSDRVSRHHLLILFVGDKWIAQDLDSSNGTYLNFEKIAAGELRPGDVLRLGETGPKLRVLALEPGPRVVPSGEEAKRFVKPASEQPKGRQGSPE
jgi:pSer/pThr/pTyr-binding forkhead associated (FHA) protein